MGFVWDPSTQQHHEGLCFGCSCPPCGLRASCSFHSFRWTQCPSRCPCSSCSPPCCPYCSPRSSCCSRYCPQCCPPCPNSPCCPPCPRLCPSRPPCPSLPQACTPALETVCNPIELAIKIIVDVEQCYPVTRTVCTESIEEIDNEICTYSYQQKTEATTAKTVEVTFVKEC